MNRITKKESSNARQYAIEILKYLQNNLAAKYIFSYKLVGSAVWNTILRDKEDYFDIDYQILLTKNSKGDLSNATKIKNDFFNCLNNYFKNKKYIKVENSTTAITLINTVEKYSIDFVIIKTFPDNNLIIRRNNKKQSSINEFTWNELKKFNNAYEKMDLLSSAEKSDLIENHVLPRKAREKLKNDGDPTKKSSCEILIEEINNYVSRKFNN